jgi:hypothetical protein
LAFTENRAICYKENAPNSAGFPGVLCNGFREQVDEEMAMGISISAVFHNPSYQSSAAEKVCGMTNTYLQPVRIGRKAVFGSLILY